MPLLFIYLFKLSISMAVMYLFYKLLLRRLTFYNHNRWYLLGYSLLCFFIPLINISPVLEKNEVENTGLVTIVPVVEILTARVLPDAGMTEAFGGWTTWSWLMLILVSGTAVLLIRLIIQFFSFQFIKRKARLISGNEIKLYQVDKDIIPFSIGNSIFINQQLHTEAELKEIIRHEFVHVKQHHTLDITWAEILCMLNWYNPFAWLIRIAIRQNLEFIADNKVLQNGTDKKEYQYLLLKVIGNNHFSVVSNFNFSSLKKRITMMNKIKTTRVHLIRFLFVLPLLTIVLLSFRSSYPVGKNKPGFSMKDLPGFIDTVPGQTTQNTKGFYIDIKDNKGNCTVVVKDRDSKEVKRMLLTEWNKKEKYYEDLYGEILSPPSTCDVPATEPIPAAPASPATLSTPSAPATPAVPAKLPVRLKNIAFGNDSNKPLTIVDGVEWPVELDMNIIDAAKIENVSVLKNESATDKYHDKGKNGVVIISTKKQAVANPQTAEIRIRKAGIPGNALYYLNDKQTTKEAVDLLDPNKIKSIDVLKGSKAEQKYGEKGKNGVIEIRTFTPPETNFIEKRNFPDWDIRNILVGKKKDEC